MFVSAAVAEILAVNHCLSDLAKRRGLCSILADTLALRESTAHRLNNIKSAQEFINLMAFCHLWTNI